MKRAIGYFRAIWEGWMFVLMGFVALLLLAVIFGEGIKWSVAFALCAGLVYASFFCVPMHFRWMLRTSRRGWDDWARRERTALYTWVVLGLTGLVIGIIMVMGT